MSSTLIVEVCNIKDIRKHPHADNLEIAVVKGWECIVPIGKYHVGDRIIYIPVNAIIPTELGDRLGVRKYLGGENQDRVRCAKLRQEMSYGLIIDNEGNWEAGTDVAGYYGITAYVPPIRAIAGDAAPNDPMFTKFTDIENIKNFPDIFKPGEIVVVTEKIDGSQDRLNFNRHQEENSQIKIEWKAGSRKVKRQPPDTQDMAENIYWFPFSLYSVQMLLFHLTERIDIQSATLFGEVYGRIRGGHKSIHYGCPNSLNYAAFSLEINNKYVSWGEFLNYCNKFEVPTVPVIDICPFDMDRMKKLAIGPSLLAQKKGANHLREGIVIVSAEERSEFKTSRAILKMLNPEYLLLKDKKGSQGEIVDFTDE